MPTSYLRIASSWNFRDTKTQPLGRGPVLATESEFLLFTFQGDLLLNDDPAWQLGPIGGMLGFLIGKAISNGSSPIVPEGLRFTNTTDLPADVRGGIGWWRSRTAKQVLIVPFDCVRSATMPWWGSLTLNLSDVRINIPAHTFGRERIRQFLEAQAFGAN